MLNRLDAVNLHDGVTREELAAILSAAEEQGMSVVLKGRGANVDRIVIRAKLSKRPAAERGS